MKTMLDTIIAHKYLEIETYKEQSSLSTECPTSQSKVDIISFYDKCINNNTIQVIAEIKRASPSKGLFAPTLNVSAQARKYVESGASAISVLTDNKFFYGSCEDLIKVRKCTSLPILCKDFIVDETQINQAKKIGATIILLIVAVLTKKRLKLLLDYSISLGLEVIIEVHDKKELEIARSLNHKLIGVNNRDLKTFKTTIQNSIELIKEITDPSIVMISESGIQTVEDVKRLAIAGYKGILVGESLIKNGLEGSLMSSMSTVKRGVK